jgi:putative phage-type endonuclease
VVAVTAVDLEVPVLVTPSGVLVYEGDPHTDAWFATRRRGITATDIPKILDLSEYGTTRHVWLDKQGLAPDDDGESEAARWGTVLEGPVADEWARRNGCEVAPVGILAHCDRRWMLASLDRIVLDCPLDAGPCGLEVKTRSAFVAGKWSMDVPDDVLAQVQWGLEVSGFDHMHVAALIGGQRLTDFVVWRDSDVIAYLKDAAERLWGQVGSREMPDCAPTAALGRLLDAMHPDRDGDVEVERATADALVAEYLDAVQAAKDAEAAKERAKVTVVDLLGPARRLVVPSDDGPVAVFSYDPRSRTSIPVAKVKADPDLWAAVEQAGAVNVSRFRQMNCLVKETSK